jgi:hypothetical protein
MNKREATVLIGALAGAMCCGPATWAPAWAQTPSAATVPQAAAAAPRKPTTATPQMIEEAIQRSQARSAKARDRGLPEQWGSEEPFTYVPGK